ncbi:MAG TPA: MlaD family protein [Gemmatimonadota bacterium]|nr:MlaD family protein [Gemmatimonadota bacterium]
MKRSSFLTWSELKVGILVVLAMLVFILAVFTLGGRTGVFTAKYPLYTLMPSVSGLTSGAPVRLAGVGVGAVDDVRFIDESSRDSLANRFQSAYGDSLGDRAVLVKFSVDRDVQDKVTRSSRVKIGTVGLLGDKYLDLEVGDPRDPTLQEGDIVLNERPIDYEGLIARAAEGVEELVGSLEGSRVLIARINEGQGTLGKLINDPELYNEWLRLSDRGTNLLQEVQSGEGALPALLNDPALYEELVAATADLQALTSEIRQGEGSLGALIRDRELYEQLVRTVNEGEALIEELQTGQGTFARMVNDPALYERLNQFVVDAQELVNDIQQNPRKYINLQIF